MISLDQWFSALGRPNTTPCPHPSFHPCIDRPRGSPILALAPTFAESTACAQVPMFFHQLKQKRHKSSNRLAKRPMLVLKLNVFDSINLRVQLRMIHLISCNSTER